MPVGGHSPVGASSIKRVLACPASVGLAHGIEDEESDHAALGTAVHSLIEHCFTTGTDGWHYIGRAVRDGRAWEPYAEETDVIIVTRQMANSAQVMLDAVRKTHPDRNQGNFWVERRFHCPTIHPLFFGTSDVIYLDEVKVPGEWSGGNGHKFRTLHIWDYKNGAGVLIEVERNEQTMYYACGALEDLVLWDKVDEVVLHIVQPNGFHPDGPVREWRTTPNELAAWLEDTLVPGIDRAATGLLPRSEYDPLAGVPSRITKSGEHCRFCPARSHTCPQLMADMEELQKMVDMIQANPKGADELTNEQLGRFLDLLTVAKIVGKAAESTAYKRIMGGGRVSGYKLVKATGFREWKDEADKAARAEFGEKALTEPKLKSPAQIDELPAGSQFTARWAQKPDKGLKLEKASDARPEVSTDTKGLFTDVTIKPAVLTIDPTFGQNLPQALPPARRRGGKNATIPV